jgi:hypothetical protein
MRDFRNAKAMAQTLRQALKTRSVELTTGESLELIASLFGLRNWNVLAARIEAVPSLEPSPAAPAGATAALQCGFCGKDKARAAKLIAGPSTAICDECVAACDDVLAGIGLHPGEGLKPARMPGADELAGLDSHELIRIKSKAGAALAQFERLLDLIAVLSSEPQVPPSAPFAPQRRAILSKSPEQRRASAREARDCMEACGRTAAAADGLLKQRGVEAGAA